MIRALLLVVDEYSRAVLADDLDADAACGVGFMVMWARGRYTAPDCNSNTAAGCVGYAASPKLVSRCARHLRCPRRRPLGPSRAQRTARSRRSERSPYSSARDQLTAQELQIATLAAEGLTNRQIAERLYLSHRTVGSHLYRIYPRLGITSRVELGSAISAIPVTARSA
ncbi:response regulator transcription factor [Nocardia salmonicida]|uniref:response regulator transcription factor n=1 Tax=Nocardia salmonicida TaxID=53431 RepID=UPI00379B0061